MVWRRVCWRAGASRGPPVSKGRRRCRRASRAGGGSRRVRAAASSMARGSPSRRRQMCATSTAFPALRANPGSTARARSRNRRRASLRVRRASAPRASRGAPGSPQGVSSPPGSPEGSGCPSPATAATSAGRGRGRGPTGSSCSPLRRSTARLVTRIVSCGQAARRRPTSGAAPCTRSKPSRISRRRRWRRKRATSAAAVSRPRPGARRATPPWRSVREQWPEGAWASRRALPRRPSAAPMAGTTCRAEVIPARGTKTHPVRERPAVRPAVRPAGHRPPRRLQGQAGLAHPAGPREHQQAHVRVVQPLP